VIGEVTLMLKNPAMQIKNPTTPYKIAVRVTNVETLEI
jgi:hypothetical protein